MRTHGLQPKLRTFTPALQCFCEAGDIARVRAPKPPRLLVQSLGQACLTSCARCSLIHQAVEIEADIRKAGVAMSELEYTLLLRAMTGCVIFGGTATVLNSRALTRDA